MHKEHILNWLLVITLATSCSTIDTQSRDRYDKKNMYKRNLNRQRSRSSRNRMSDFRRLNNQSHWMMYAPETPSPEEIDCHIEVEVTELVGGKCVRLGGEFRLAVCQSGMHVDFWSGECQFIMARRDMHDSEAREANGSPAGSNDVTSGSGQSTGSGTETTSD